MDKQIPIDSSARADEIESDGIHEVAPDLGYQRVGIVNVVYQGAAEAADRQWTLVDAGLFGTAGIIRAAAESRFGGSRPSAIVLTHGHFDHVGALAELADDWDVPIYAHPLELPYLDGRSSYPPPDPTVGGGMMSTLSRFYPRGPVDVGHRLKPLPADGSVPGMPGWRWLHTPGHTPGHVALWREADRALIAGDAFITTGQESAYAVATQRPELHGPPMYFTQDWGTARDSVRVLAQLEPELAMTGHGRALEGEEMRKALHALATDFDRVAVPAQGRYVTNPAEADETGTIDPPSRATEERRT